MADSAGETIVTRSYKTVIETFSIWAAVSFVVSGLVGALLFYTQFRMNYFEVAQPTDIVMAGFIKVAFVVFVVLLLGSMFYVERRLHNFIINMFYKLFSKGYSDHIVQHKLRKFNRFQKFASPASAAISFVIVFGLQIVVGTTSIRVDWHGIHFARKEGVGYWDRPLPKRGVSNLYLSEASDQFTKCGHAPVIWMGSSSVILNCNGRARLIQNTENLFLDRYSPSEMAHMQQNELLKAKVTLLRALRANPDKPQPERVPVPAASATASGR